MPPAYYPLRSPIHHPWLAVLAMVAVAATLSGAGCSGASRLDSAYAGRTLVYEAGLPNFDLEAIATMRDGRPGVDLYLGIPRASLVFVPRDSVHTARFETLIRVLDEKGKIRLAEVDDVDTVWVADYPATQSFEPFLKERRLDLDPGIYVLDVVVTDAQSGRQAERRQRVEVVRVGARQPALSRIRMEARRAGRPFEPMLSLHVPAGIDSLRAVVELYNAQPLGEVDVSMRLVRFPSDTASAKPPYLYAVTTFYSLIRYDRPDTIQVTRRRVADPDQEVVLAFNLPLLDEGIYRLDVRARRAGADEEAGAALLEQRRDFAVRSAAFPRIATLDEMVDALVYVASKRELAHLRAAETPEEKKRRFDAFWGGLVANRRRAANLIKLYYSRVEEANLRYTTHKAGWKTDRGMVYVMLGAPLYVDDRIDRQVWHYSYDERDPQRVFVFTRRRLYASEGLFDAYVLERDYVHEASWRRAYERWRRGDML